MEKNEEPKKGSYIGRDRLFSKKRQPGPREKEVITYFGQGVKQFSWKGRLAAFLEVL